MATITVRVSVGGLPEGSWPFDKPVDHHGLTHGQGNEHVRSKLELDHFHIQQFTSLVMKMKKLRKVRGHYLII